MYMCKIDVIFILSKFTAYLLLNIDFIKNLNYLFFILGSTQSTAMLATLEKLHEMAVPNENDNYKGGLCAQLIVYSVDFKFKSY